MLEKILTIVNTTHAVLGSDAAKTVLGALSNSMKLSDEQRQNLEANHADYVRRIAKLEAEIAAGAGGGQSRTEDFLRHREPGPGGG